MLAMFPGQHVGDDHLIMMTITVIGRTWRTPEGAPSSGSISNSGSLLLSLVLNLLAPCLDLMSCNVPAAMPPIGGGWGSEEPAATEGNRSTLDMRVLLEVCPLLRKLCSNLRAG